MGVVRERERERESERGGGGRRRAEREGVEKREMKGERWRQGLLRYV